MTIGRAVLLICVCLTATGLVTMSAEWHGREGRMAREGRLGYGRGLADISCHKLVKPGRGIHPNLGTTIVALIKNVSGSPADSIPVCGSLGTTPMGADVWTDTQMIGTLAPFTETLVAFDPCTLITDVGEGYWLTVYVDYGDTNPDNDTCQTYMVITTRLRRYDDGGAEAAMVLSDSGTAWGVDFHCPLEICTLQQIWWQVRCDWPDMDREPVNLYVFQMVNDTPATIPLWGPVCDTADDCDPAFAVHDLDPPLGVGEHFLIAVEQLTDSDDIDAVQTDKSWLRWGIGPSYWDHYWERSPEGGWTKLDATDTTATGVGNLFIRGLVSPWDWYPEYDVKVRSLSSPGLTVRPYSWCEVEVEATVKNLGEHPETFDVECLIRDESDSIVFADTVEVFDLDVHDYEDVSFSPWGAPSPPGIQYTISVQTLLATDERPENDTALLVTETDTWVRWDDGEMEDALAWYEPGGRFAVEFSEPCPCSVEKIRWMVHEDWPDGPELHPVDLEIYTLPDTSLVWSASNVPTTGGNPLWSEYTIPSPEVPVLSHFLVAVVQLSDLTDSDGLGIDTDSPYRGRDWEKPAGWSWQSPAGHGNLMVRAEMGGCFPSPWAFIRGDLDTIAGTNMADAVYLLKYLYVPGSDTPVCMDAADVDDAGSGDSPTMGDAIYLLKWLYVPGSPPPPDPCGEGVYPLDCGTDPTPDEMDCLDHLCNDY